MACAGSNPHHEINTQLLKVAMRCGKCHIKFELPTARSPGRDKTTKRHHNHKDSNAIPYLLECGHSICRKCKENEDSTVSRHSWFILKVQASVYISTFFSRTPSNAELRRAGRLLMENTYRWIFQFWEGWVPWITWRLHCLIVIGLTPGKHAKI